MVIMKNVLIICHDFPPNNSVGALRPFYWFQNFKANNVFPIIATRHWNKEIKTNFDLLHSSNNQEFEKTTLQEGIILKAPYKATLRDKMLLKYGESKWQLPRKMLTLVEYLLRHYFSFFDPTNGIYKVADKFLSENQNKVDYIIATGEPWIDFKYAYKLSKKYNIPWMADYRDGWTTNVGLLNLTGWRKLIQVSWFQIIELKYLKSAHTINFTDPCELPKLKNIYPTLNYSNFQNGYNESLINKSLDTLPNKNEFTISYAGTIYDFQDLESFLDGVFLFVEKLKPTNFKINFIGAAYYPEQVTRIFKCQSSLHQFIITTNRIKQEEVIKMMLESHCLLILSNPNHIALPSKIFEYFAYNRKILVSVDDKAIISDLMKECNGGYLCQTSNEIALAIEKLYLEFADSKTVVHASVGYQKYSREAQTKLLCNYINEL
jgi:glycosyltransferase involved in cell wall biosynthesis